MTTILTPAVIDKITFCILFLFTLLGIHMIICFLRDRKIESMWNHEFSQMLFLTCLTLIIRDLLGPYLLSGLKRISTLTYQHNVRIEDICIPTCTYLVCVGYIGSLIQIFSDTTEKKAVRVFFRASTITFIRAQFASIVLGGITFMYLPIEYYGSFIAFFIQGQMVVLMLSILYTVCMSIDAWWTMRYES